jgi:hypothetical protein
MIDKLARRLLDFPGRSNRARCFTHILNLVVKSIMHQFDVPSTKSAVTDKWTHELNELAGDIEAEELETQAEEENSQDELDEEGPCPDNDEGWVDERDDMSEEEINELEESIQPIRVLLTKVSE